MDRLSGSMRQFVRELRNRIPPLTTRHKGEMGRIAVVGGSKEYTGAPYFAGISALHCGADLVHVICAEAAAPVIKSYSPDLIVHPDLDNNFSESRKWIEKAHSAVFGPGLGRGENWENTAKLIKHCCSANKPVVIDADGLALITEKPDLIKDRKMVILTPNVVEFSRLYSVLFGCNPPEKDTDTQQLAQRLGNVTVVLKGEHDTISDGSTTVICDLEGSPRRCGGQGDMLSGTAATFFHWFHQFSPPQTPNMLPTPVAAGLAACMLTRQCSQQAFAKHGRSMVTAQMIEQLHPAFEELFESPLLGDCSPHSP
ncbi:ATP-dependent (S)-NAD(P)H-hydrate dehydratase [Fasciolopsis buskii]|uniref:ATP-dependent (S)-NAD(P)H-hydrate dehydratase n=1 Tax=Fasciolopsis buskii TaxID=27845 RepID=A0A8E0SBG6_9TREM|nr:ATP-dependent (S)-NAD(P)H-hydrate dehydratase [Fasciolopsis buski]